MGIAGAEGAAPVTPRPHFGLKTLFWLAAVVGALFAGMAIQQQLDRPVPVGRTRAELRTKNSVQYVWMEMVRLRDGTEWQRLDPDGPLPDQLAEAPGDRSVAPSPPHLHLRPRSRSTATKATN